MAVDSKAFRTVMGRFATGVTIITTHDGAGNHVGLTANAVSSVSLEPPLVLFCIDSGAESRAAFEKSGVYNVNILAESQENLSNQFAKSGGDKFAGVSYDVAPNGAALLNGAMAHLECEIRQSVVAGDHVILIAEATAIRCEDGVDPLLFFSGGYRKIAS